MSEESATVVRRERIDVGLYGSLEVPIEHNATVESRLGVPNVFRYLFGFSVVAVTGGPALTDVGVAVDGTFAKYVNKNAQWSPGDAGPIVVDDGSVRRVVREFTWTNDYLEMVSVVSCVSDDERSMILNGSCAVNVGAAELDTLRAVVASAELP